MCHLAQLQIENFLVKSSLRQQIIMPASLNDVPIGHDQDQIRPPYCCQPVSDHKCSPAFHKAIECFLDKQLGLGIY